MQRMKIMKTYNNMLVAVMVAAAAWGYSGKTTAQPARRMTLEQCVDSALNNNPAITIKRLEVEKAQTMQTTAFDPGNTSITLSQDPSSGGNPDNSITLSQSFDFPTVYAARHKALKAQTLLSKSSEKMAHHELRKQITDAYLLLVYTCGVADIYRQQQSTYKRFVNIATTRQETGEGGQLERINAERAEKDNEMALQQAEVDKRAAAATLKLLMGANYYVEPTDTLSFAPTTHTNGAFSIEGTPWGEELESSRNVAEQNKKVAAQSFLPEINVALRAQTLIKGFNPYHIDRERFKGDFMGFEIGVGIPLFYGAKKAKLKAAQKDVEIEKTRQRQTLQAMQRQYEGTRDAYKKAQAKANYFVKEALPQTRKMVNIANEAYEKGEIGYVEYMQNLQTAATVRLQTAEALWELNRDGNELNYLQGYKE